MIYSLTEVLLSICTVGMLLVFTFLASIKDLKRREVSIRFLIFSSVFVLIPTLILRIKFEGLILIPSIFLCLIPLIFAMICQYRTVLKSKRYAYEAQSPFGFMDGAFLSLSMFSLPILCPILPPYQVELNTLVIFLMILAAVAEANVVRDKNNLQKHSPKPYDIAGICIIHITNIASVGVCLMYLARYLMLI